MSRGHSMNDRDAIPEHAAIGCSNDQDTALSSISAALNASLRHRRGTSFPVSGLEPVSVVVMPADSRKRPAQRPT
jgi:hypothetical protein